MDGIQTQINELHQKVNQLYQLVERISDQINSLAGNAKQEEAYEAYSMPSLSSTATKSTSGKLENFFISHKDILVDDNSKNKIGSSKEQELSPDIQIRRLTAQLTAAYNRIAALEEQLLSYRIKS